MNSLAILIIVFISHFIADYPLQTYVKAMQHKNKKISALLLHTATYTIVITLFALVHTQTPAIMTWGILNGILHGTTDAITSKLSYHFYEQKQISHFFTTLGVDQLIHTLTLLITTEVLLL